MSSPPWTGSATFGWRLDGLIGSRGWPTTNSAAFGYDGLKRPTSMTESASGSSQAVLGQTYDRAGNVTSESRSLSGITGAGGTGSQDFTYDDLRRVTSATLAGTTTSYTYDPSGDRTSVTRAGVTTAYTYDRADQRVTKQVGTDPATSFAYDTYGNLTTSQVAASGATGYTYDAADRLLSIDPVGTSDTVGFTLDALGRNRTRSVDGTLADTYAYLGESESVTVLDRTVDVDAALSADGSRLAIKSGTTLGWTLPDLHGSLAAVVSGTGGSVTDALRYDAYGETAASTTSALPTPWRYQGNLLLSEPGTAELYENGARAYDPALGVFTQLDPVVGSAQEPMSLNRYLYAWADPTTLTDPSGHCPGCFVSLDGEYYGGGVGYQRAQAARSANRAWQQRRDRQRAAQRSMAAQRSRYTWNLDSARDARDWLGRSKPRPLPTPHPAPRPVVQRWSGGGGIGGFGSGPALILDTTEREFVGRSEQVRLNYAAGRKLEDVVEHPNSSGDSRTITRSSATGQC